MKKHLTIYILIFALCLFCSGCNTRKAEEKISEHKWKMEFISDLEGNNIENNVSDTILTFRKDNSFMLIDNTNNQECLGTYKIKKVDSSYKLDLYCEDTDMTFIGVYGTREYDDRTKIPSITLQTDDRILSFIDISSESVKNPMSSTADKYGITNENYPRIDGSTSTLGIVRGINGAMYKDRENENMPEEASKTVPSYKLLINDEVDMIIVPYASSEVLTLAKDAGVELEFFKIAAEALIFITPIENEAENITLDQVREIYLNNGIKNWSKLGGPDRKLVPICRNADSGSQSQIDNLILKGDKMQSDIENNYVELTMEGMLEQVAFYHGGGLDASPTQSYALGYTLYTYLKNVGSITGIDEELKMLAFEGVVPSEKNIADGSYSLSDGYYAVVRKDLSKYHSARSIIDWLRSEEGQSLISGLRFITGE